MGYGTRPNDFTSNGIRTFWPDDTDTEMFIEADYNSISMSDLLCRIAEKWPDQSCPLGFDAGSIHIEAEYIHTDCLGYDRYDSGDYTRFLKITKKG